jgi:chaperonin GroES
MNHVTTLDRVVVIRDKKETTTSSGLIIPDLDPLVRTDTGLVVATGPGRTTKKNVVVEVTVAVGDRIMFDSGAGINIRTDGEDLVVLKEDEIIGVLENE